MIEPNDNGITTQDKEISGGDSDVAVQSSAVPFDEKPASDAEKESAKEKSYDGAEADGKESDKADEAGGTVVGNLIGVWVKTVAVTLSVVFLLLAILTVAMPLSAMRVFNRMGWSERALNSGDRYITHRLEKNDADAPDGMGNFTALSAANLNDADMREAYDVCIGLSRDLMNSTAKNGDGKSARYFAEKLEKYTRQYMSLGGIMTTNREKSIYNVENVPDIRMRPYVYDYSHTVMLDNFRARTYTGELDKMLYDSGRSGDCVIGIQTLANTYESGSIPESSHATAEVIDGFVDYIDQLGVYLSVKFDDLGLPANMNESTFVEMSEEVQHNVPSKYCYVLSGNELDLFITPTGGYTEIYNKLKGGFTRYAQAAADFNAVTVEDELHKLYWLQALSGASAKLWYMSMLLYFDKTGSYGMSRGAIEQEYGKDGVNGTCEMYKFVKYDYFGTGVRSDTELIDVYNKCMRNYLKHFTAAA